MSIYRQSILDIDISNRAMWRCVFFECVSESKYKQKRIAGQSLDDNIEISNREVAGFVSLGDI